MTKMEPGDPAIASHCDDSIQNSGRWHPISCVNRITINHFVAFLREINTNIDEYPADGNLDNKNIYTWENL